MNTKYGTVEWIEEMITKVEEGNNSARLQEIQRLTKKLRRTFDIETAGLDLHFDLHDRDRQGSPDDDVDGPFFVVTGLRSWKTSSESSRT